MDSPTNPSRSGPASTIGGRPSGSAVTTSTGAVGPVAWISIGPASAVASLVYNPGVAAAKASKSIVNVSSDSTMNGPSQLSVLPSIAGSADVAPSVEPGS